MRDRGDLLLERGDDLLGVLLDHLGYEGGYPHGEKQTADGAGEESYVNSGYRERHTQKQCPDNYENSAHNTLPGFGLF